MCKILKRYPINKKITPINSFPKYPKGTLRNIGIKAPIAKKRT